MSSEKSISDYRALLEKVSAKFAEIQKRQGHRMTCARGCSACCAPDLSVFAVERENIARLINATPGLEEKLRRLDAEDPHRGTQCRFLDEDRACSIYEARPIICRSHGAPIFSKEVGEAVADVCPLNFQDDPELATLGPEDFVNIDLLNQLLALINKGFEPDGKGRRHPLTVSGVLGDANEEGPGK